MRGVYGKTPMASDAGPPPARAPVDLAPLIEALSAVLRARLGGDGRVVVVERLAGNVNTVLRLAYAGRSLGVRVALNPYRFRYERDIIKEVFAIFLICYARPSPNDRLARDLIAGILRSPVGSQVNHSWVRTIVHYDWSMAEVPWPYFVYEWAEGAPLWLDPRPGHYAGAGRDLARLHRICFGAYYADIFRIGREPLDWRRHFAAALEREVRLADGHLPPAVRRRIEALDPAAIRPGTPTLVHNDYSGGNIVVSGEGIRKIIDWDNWVVDSPELDFVKMKYWTVIGDDGLLVPDEDLYGAFLEGYREAGGRPPDPDRLRAYEALWLLRAFNFENAGRTEEEHAADAVDRSWGRHYPPAATYEDYLRAI